jgi:hypothetical protein
MMADVESVQSETITVIAQKINVPAAREDIATVARVLELDVEAIVEKPRRLKTELQITLSGPPDRIDDFRGAIGGRGFSSGPNSGIADSIISDLLDDVVEAVRRRRWRLRRKG